MKGLGLGLDKLKFKASGEAVVNPFADAKIVLDLNDRGFGNVPVATVRESDGNTQQNFTAAQMANGDAQSFTGVNDGFVQLLDHTGNNNNGLQTIINNQPKSIDSGDLILNNGNLVSLFDGVRSRLNVNFSAQPTISFVIKARLLTNSQVFAAIIDSNINTIDFCILQNASTFLYELSDGSDTIPASSVPIRPIDVKIFCLRGVNNQLWINDVTEGNFAGTSPSFSNFVIGLLLSADRNVNMLLESFVLWDSDKSADRIEIQNAL